jgi:hypothetical protein
VGGVGRLSEWVIQDRGVRWGRKYWASVVVRVFRARHVEDFSCLCRFLFVSASVFLLMMP